MHRRQPKVATHRGFLSPTAEISYSYAYRIGADKTHITFTVHSRKVVDEVYLAALKAGGLSHFPPALKNQETELYSAAILDFDDNCIEIRHREIPRGRSGRICVGSERLQIQARQKDVAKSTINADSPDVRHGATHITVNNFTTRAVVVTGTTANLKTENGLSNRDKSILAGIAVAAGGAAIVSTLMGKSEEGSIAALEQKVITYATKEIHVPAPRPLGETTQRPYGAVRIEPPPTLMRQINSLKSINPSNRHVEQADWEATPYHISRSCASKHHPRVETLPSSSETSRGSRSGGQSRASDRTAQTSGTKIFTGGSQHSPASHASSGHRTVKQSDLARLPPPSPVTEVNVAKAISLPTSKLAISVLSPPGNEEDLRSELRSLRPSDSISQVSSKKSGPSKISKSQGGSKVVGTKSHQRNGSQASRCHHD